eukprot:1355635-Amphidinium_carterae.3
MVQGVGTLLSKRVRMGHVVHVTDVEFPSQNVREGKCKLCLRSCWIRSSRRLMDNGHPSWQWQWLLVTCMRTSRNTCSPKIDWTQHMKGESVREAEQQRLQSSQAWAIALQRAESLCTGKQKRGTWDGPGIVVLPTCMCEHERNIVEGESIVPANAGPAGPRAEVTDRLPKVGKNHR